MSDWLLFVNIVGRTGGHLGEVGVFPAVFKTSIFRFLTLFSSLDTDESFLY